MTAMEQIAEISCKARAAGLTYGEYVKIHKPERPEEKQTRVCKTCGREFTPPLLKNGEVSKKKNCAECTAKIREKDGLPPAHHFTKVYTVRCAKCGRKMTTRRAPGIWHRNICTTCKTAQKSAYMKQYKKSRRGADGNKQ